MRMTIVDVPEEALVESRAVNQLVEDFLVQTPSIHTVDVAETRRARAEGRGPLGPIVVVDEGDDRTIAGPAGDIPLRVFVPPTVRAVFLHLHGGGRTFGGAGQQDPLLWRLAQDAEVAVVSVEYRLAPEHPFPAGPDDCEAAARWLVDNSADVFGTSRLLIGGESAGAHLAALTLLRLRDRHGITGAFEAANLVFGAFDLGMTPSQLRWGDRNLVLSTPIMAWFYECFTPGLESEERRDPEISPLWADLSGMPPALFTVGTLDPLLDDSLFMASRWAAAGNRADLRVYPESIHGFVAFPTKLGQLALDSQLDFVKSVVASS